jgi:hypothetical protein
MRLQDNLALPASIVIQAEDFGDTPALFRLLVDGREAGRQLTVAAAHALVGDILEKIALPDRRATASPRGSR